MINPEYEKMIPTLKKHFQEAGIVSLQQFLVELPKLPELQAEYKPAFHRYESASIILDQLSNFIEQVTGSKPQNWQVQAFSHKSFSLRKPFAKDGIFAVLDVSDDFPEHAGGDAFVVYEDESLSLPKTSNTLTIFRVQENDESFVTYVNHNAQNKSRTIVLVMDLF